MLLAFTRGQPVHTYSQSQLIDCDEYNANFSHKLQITAQSKFSTLSYYGSICKVLKIPKWLTDYNNLNHEKLLTKLACIL